MMTRVPAVLAVATIAMSLLASAGPARAQQRSSPTTASSASSPSPAAASSVGTLETSGQNPDQKACRRRCNDAYANGLEACINQKGQSAAKACEASSRDKAAACRDRCAARAK